MYTDILAQDNLFDNGNVYILPKSSAEKEARKSFVADKTNSFPFKLFILVLFQKVWL